MEIWKDVKGFEGIYQVSNCGNVRNRKGDILKPATNKDGRKHVILRKSGKAYTRKIHRLVAIAFIPNPLNFAEVNHKDEDPTNNSADNLEWCDRYYNQHYGTAIQRMSESMKGKFLGGNSVLSKKICQYSMNGEFIAEWNSLHEITRELKVNYANISSCCSGRRQSAGGFKWSLKKALKI